MRDIDRLNEICTILHNMQTTPQTYAGRRGSCNVQRDGIKIAKLIKAIETNIHEESIDVVSYGGRGDKYLSRWKLVGETLPMNFSGGLCWGKTAEYSGSQKLGMCVLRDGQDDHMIGSPEAEYQCTICADNWDGSVPGEVVDHGTLPSSGWFSNEISFCRKLIQVLRVNSLM